MKNACVCAFPLALQSTNSRNILSPWIHSTLTSSPLPPSLLSFHKRTVGILPPNPLPLWQNPRACAPTISEAMIWSTNCTEEEAIMILEVGRNELQYIWGRKQSVTYCQSLTDSSMKVLKERCKSKVKTSTRSGHWSNSFPLDDFFS